MSRGDENFKQLLRAAMLHCDPWLAEDARAKLQTIERHPPLPRATGKARGKGRRLSAPVRS